MLVIRAAQIEVLASSARAAYSRRVIAHLRADLPDLAADHSDASLQALIAEAAALGDRCAMTTEHDVFWLVLFRLCLGPGFEHSTEHPWIGAILADPDMPGGVKALQIRTRLTAVTVQEPAHGH